MTNYRPLPELSLSYKVDPTTHNKEMTVQFLQTVNRQLAAEANPVRYKDLLIARDNASQIIELIDKEREVLLENQRNKEKVVSLNNPLGSAKNLTELMENPRVDSYKVVKHNQGFGNRHLHTIMSVNGEKIEHLTSTIMDGLTSCYQSAKGWKEKAEVRPPVFPARFPISVAPPKPVPATSTIPIVVNLTPQQIEEFGRHTSGNYPNHLKREIAKQIADKYDQVIVASYSPSTGIKKTIYEPSTFKRHAEQLVRETGVNPYVCVILGSGDQVMMTAEHHMLYMKDTNKIPQFGAASLTGR